MTIEKQFVSYKIALKLKEIGFDEPIYCFDETFWYINGNFSLCNDEYKELLPEKEYVLAPLYQQVLQWFREKHKWHISFAMHEFDKWCFGIQRINRGLKENPKIAKHNNWDIRDYKEICEAKDAAILKTIELIKNSTTRASTTEM